MGDKCVFATTQPCELGPDLRQGDGVWWSVGTFSSNSLYFSRTEACAGRPQIRDRPKIISSDALPADPGTPPGSGPGIRPGKTEGNSKRGAAEERPTQDSLQRCRAPLIRPAGTFSPVGEKEGGSQDRPWISRSPARSTSRRPLPWSRRPCRAFRPIRDWSRRPSCWWRPGRFSNPGRRRGRRSRDSRSAYSRQ